MEPFESDGSNFREEYDDEDPRMTDLVEVAHARHAAEASFLCAQLEEAEIPAAVSGGHMAALYGGMPAVDSRILVPRHLASQAAQIITKVREEANRKSIEQGFDHDSIAEELDADNRDPKLVEALEMVEWPIEARLDALRVKAALWINDGDRTIDIAQRLAAAGLSREQADTLMTSVIADPKLLLDKKNFRIRIGSLCVIGGSLIIYAANGLVGWGIFSYGVVSIIWGLTLHPPKWHTQAPAEPAPPQEDDAPQS